MSKVGRIRQKQQITSFRQLLKSILEWRLNRAEREDVKQEDSAGSIQLLPS